MRGREGRRWEGESSNCNGEIVIVVNECGVLSGSVVKRAVYLVCHAQCSRMPRSCVHASPALLRSCVPALLR